MHVAKDLVVSLDYTLRDDAGEVIDSTQGDEPLPYLHGHGGLIAGLERQLEGKSPGDALKVTVTPEDGYGERDEALVFDIPKSDFDDVEGLEVGAPLEAEIDGELQLLTVIGIAEDQISVDGNHPLAGKTLHFEVLIKDVRKATAEELKHGHVHGPGCNHDH